MGRLKYEEVKNIIESAGWSLITENYQNLDQELELRCPENHRVFTSLKKFRNAPYCPNCSTNSFKVIDDKIIAKKKGIHTTIDTAGNPFTMEEPFYSKFVELMKYTDLWRMRESISMRPLLMIPTVLILPARHLLICW